MEIRICHMYPDVLDLYGDRGNLIAMKKRLEWRGIDCCIEKLPLGSSKNLSGFDLIFFGGGQEFENGAIAADLRSGRAAEISAAIEDGVSVLAICSGFQLLGHYTEDAKGVKTELAGAVDVYTVAGSERRTGDYKFICGEKSGSHEVIGFENHLGRSYLGEGLEPLGKVICGCGNNGEDGGEGLRYKNVFASYSYGPLLPKNPGLCDSILLCTLERKYSISSLEPLGDLAERSAFDAMNARLAK